MTYQDYIDWVCEAPFFTVDGELCKIIMQEVDSETAAFIAWDVDENDIVLEDEEDFEDFCHLSVSEGDNIELDKDQYDRPYVTIRNAISDKETIVTRFFQEGF